tara:strand:+ start:14085 stop:14465 length:381 start_codon:yes stop_codon:yes gene_type:complete
MVSFTLALVALLFVVSSLLHRHAWADLKGRREYAKRQRSASLDQPSQLGIMEAQLHDARPNLEGRLSVPVECHGGLFDGAVGQTGISKPGDIFSCEGPEGKAVYMLSIFTKGSWKAQALTLETTKL